MKVTLNVMVFFAFSSLISSCSRDLSTIEKDKDLAENLTIHWELVSNQIADQPQYRSAFLIKNNSNQTLNDSGWAIFFSQENSTSIPESVTETVEFTSLGGDFNRLSPKKTFHLQPKNETVIQLDCKGWLIKEQQAPSGVYIVFYNEEGKERSRYSLSNFIVQPFLRPEQINRFTFDQTPNPTTEWQYEQNEKLFKLDKSEIPLIVPTPISTTLGSGSISIDDSFLIHFGKGLESEASFLVNRLKVILGVTLPSIESVELGNNIISLSTNEEQSIPESYRLKVRKNNGISIEGNDASGVFYGIQSLLALFPIDNYKHTLARATVPTGIIEDAPRFPYRGMHLDVSRNFSKKEAVFKLLDVMAFYKLNKFHLHLTDDEGWRLEIESLPELTRIGAFRGHTLDDQEYLHPSYGSGPEPDASSSFGSGFYSQDDFIQILKYAHARHIAVIPEFDLPGHARAAVKSMEARYNRLMEDGKEEQANEYRLADPDDASVYNSAQEFSDNVICVCQESTYRFVETIVDEVIALYHKAQIPLETIHIGGDEVPKGAWGKSPICDEFLTNNDKISGSAGLMDYFLQRTAKILQDRNLTLSGWEEITLNRDESGNFVVKPPKKDYAYQVYIWDNFTSGNQDIGYKIANADYPVVLCSVTNFYFELAYNKDPKEPGHYWGGFVDTYKPFEYIPFDVFKSIHTTPLGKPYVPDTDFKDMVRLNQKAQKNILGLQGELWSEPILGPEMLEYFYLPKLLGLAERAWATQPNWALIEDKEDRQKVLDEDWNIFANVLGNQEMPRLDYIFGGYNYRLPPPGAKVIDGYLYANIQFPGLTIRYTTDGSEPDLNSIEYVEPVPVTGTVRLIALNTNGRSSRVVEVAAH